MADQQIVPVSPSRRPVEGKTSGQQEVNEPTYRTCLKELCKICSVVLRHVNLDSLAESRQGKAGSALTLHHIK